MTTRVFSRLARDYYDFFLFFCSPYIYKAAERRGKINLIRTRRRAVRDEYGERKGFLHTARRRLIKILLFFLLFFPRFVFALWPIYATYLHTTATRCGGLVSLTPCPSLSPGHLRPPRYGNACTPRCRRHGRDTKYSPRLRRAIVFWDQFSYEHSSSTACYLPVAIVGIFFFVWPWSVSPEECIHTHTAYVYCTRVVSYAFLLMYKKKKIIILYPFIMYERDTVSRWIMARTVENELKILRGIEVNAIAETAKKNSALFFGLPPEARSESRKSPGRSGDRKKNVFTTGEGGGKQINK